MNSKENVIAALDFKVPDMVPVGTYEFWDAFTDRWVAEKGFAAEASPEDYYKLDIRHAIPIEEPFFMKKRVISSKDDVITEVDGWGRTIQRKKNAYFYKVLHDPLEEKASIDKLVFDSPELDSRYTEYINYVACNKDKYYTVVKIGGPYIRSSFLRGEERWLIDFALDEVFSRELLHMMSSHLIEVGKNAILKGEMYDTGILFADDMASNIGPTFSPKMFEKYLLPEYERMVKEFKKAGIKKVIFHSDGNITPLLEYLIEAGVDAINPLEPRAMNVRKTKELLKGRMAIIGGLCNTIVLPSGDRKLIKEHVLELKELTLEGGFVPYAHSIAEDVSTSDWEYALDIFRE